MNKLKLSEMPEAVIATVVVFWVLMGVAAFYIFHIALNQVGI